MKIQRSGNGCSFVDMALGEGWSTSIDAFDGAVTIGPYAGKEESRRPLSEEEIESAKLVAKVYYPRHDIWVFRR